MTVYSKNRRLSDPVKLFLLLLFVGQGSPIMVFSQQLSFSFKKAALEDVFREIEKKTAYRFIYTREEIKNARPVTLTVRNTIPETVINRLFEMQPLSFAFDKNYIMVHKKEEPASAPVSMAEIDITGQVFNEKGGPVTGASVTVISSSAITATNEQGRFFLPAIPENSTLIISSIGYNPQQVPLRGRTRITIQLSLSITVLDEAIIKGYYSTSRRLNTGAVSKVTAAEIARQPVSNPLAALQGRVPGLFIRQGNGLPGSNFTLLIRGQNSIINGTAPLFIIDGVPYITGVVSQRGASMNANNPFNTIPPSDIESIEVLKDADATSIYGSRGASGVILITTKKAKEGKTTADLNAYTGWGAVTRLQTFMNTQQYLAMRKKAFQNDGQEPSLYNAPDLLAWDTTRYTDWTKLLVGNTAKTTNLSARISGGSPLTRFSLNTTYYRETTVFSDDLDDRRASMNLNVFHTTRDTKFSISIASGYAYERNKLITQDLSSLLNLVPNLPALKDSLGRLNWSEGGVTFFNPLSVLQKTNTGVSRRLTSNLLLSYKPTTHLTFKTSLGYNSFRFDETLLSPIASQNPADNPLGSASFATNDFNGWIIEPQADYMVSIGGKGTFQGLVGATLQQNENKSTVIDAINYTNDALLQSLGGAGALYPSNSSNRYNYEAAYTRLNYNQDNKYLLNVTARRDGSSRFGPDKQFATFYAIGTGWIFSEEKGVKKKLPFLNYGKLNASYGTTGNDQIGDYQYLDSWTTTQYPYAEQPGLQPARLFNADYSWEISRKLNLALETGWLQNRILVSANWFLNRSSNQLIPYSLPSQAGFSFILRNFPGVVENKGWEIEATTINIQRKAFSWKTSFNISIPKNTLIAFPGLERSGYANTYRIGKPLAARIGYLFLGVDPEAGVYQFEDINKDGVLNTADYVYNGTTNPVFYGGLQNSLTFKNWQLHLLLQFTRQMGTDPVLSGFTLTGDMTNQPRSLLTNWQTPGDKVLFQKHTQSFGTPATNAAILVFQSGAALTNASYARLKNLSLSYTLPASLAKKLKMDNCQLYIQGQNLVTMTKYKGDDPENQNGLPPLKMFTLGFQLTF